VKTERGLDLNTASFWGSSSAKTLLSLKSTVMLSRLSRRKLL